MNTTGHESNIGVVQLPWELLNSPQPQSFFLPFFPPTELKAILFIEAQFTQYPKEGVNAITSLLYLQI
jgi:hypothetical protein